MKSIFVLRQSESLVFACDGETFTFEARKLTDAKRRAGRKQFHAECNLQLEDERGTVVSVKRVGRKWEDKG